MHRDVHADEPGLDGGVLAPLDDEKHDLGGDDDIFFRGHRDAEYGWLSNFHPSPIEIDGFTYATVEHWFQASKARTDIEHDVVRTTASPQEAKRAGRRLQLRDDWEGCKLEIMRAGLLSKFTQHSALGHRLLATGERAIHEDARHDDQWGWGGGRGRDLLGRLLIEVRNELRRERTGG